MLENIRNGLQNMNDKTKFVLKTAALVGGVLIITVGIYRIFFKTPAQPEQVVDIEKTTQPSQGLPLQKNELQSGPYGVLLQKDTEKPPSQTISQIALGGLTKTNFWVESGASQISLNSSGSDANFYDINNQKFYKIGSSGKIAGLSSKTFPGVENVNWAPNQNKAIIEYPDGGNILFDFDSQKQTTLPKNWTSFDFSDDGNQIAAKSLNPDSNSRWLIISNPDGSEALPVTLLGENVERVKVSWSPDGRYLGFSETGPSPGRNLKSIYLISKEKRSGSYDQILVEGGDFRPNWSPDGALLLYSVYTEDALWNPNLFVIDASPGNFANKKIDLGIQTWADKCVFADSSTLYCAVPKELKEGYGLVPEIAKEVPDIIMKIDLSTGSKAIAADPDNDITVNKIYISDNGGSLILHDKNKGSITEIKLK